MIGDRLPQPGHAMCGHHSISTPPRGSNGSTFGRTQHMRRGGGEIGSVCRCSLGFLEYCSITTLRSRYQCRQSSHHWHHPLTTTTNAPPALRRCLDTPHPTAYYRAYYVTCSAPTADRPSCHSTLERDRCAYKQIHQLTGAKPGNPSGRTCIWHCFTNCVTIHTVTERVLLCSPAAVSRLGAASGKAALHIRCTSSMHADDPGRDVPTAAVWGGVGTEWKGRKSIVRGAF